VKALFLQCSSFSYDCIRTALPNTLEEGGFTSYSNCAVVFISVEVEDDTRVARAAKAIRRVARNANTGVLILSGFAHLSDNLASFDDSQLVLQRLQQALRNNQEWEVVTTPFGWHKTMSMTALADKWSQRFITA